MLLLLVLAYGCEKTAAPPSSATPELSLGQRSLAEAKSSLASKNFMEAEVRAGTALDLLKNEKASEKMLVQAREIKVEALLGQNRDGDALALIKKLDPASPRIAQLQTAVDSRTNSLRKKQADEELAQATAAFKEGKFALAQRSASLARRLYREIGADSESARAEAIATDAGRKIATAQSEKLALKEAHEAALRAPRMVDGKLVRRMRKNLTRARLVEVLGEPWLIATRPEDVAIANQKYGYRIIWPRVPDTIVLVYKGTDGGDQMTNYLFYENVRTGLSSWEASADIFGPGMRPIDVGPNPMRPIP